MKKYEKYKDNGIEWLDEIPSCWNVKKIKYIVNDNDKSFIDGDWIEAPYITDEGIRLIQTGNIGIGLYKEQGNRYISQQSFKKLNCTEIYPGDVLICRLAHPVGRACLCPELKDRMITSVDVCILRSNEEVLNQYLVYVFSSDKYLKYADLIARGSTRQRISRTQLGEIKIPIPNIFEQSTIVRYLDKEIYKIDKLINKKEEIIETLKISRQKLISEIVTKGIDKEVEMKDSGVEWIGKIPKHWGISKVKYKVDINKNVLSEKTNDEYEIKYIDIGSVDSSGNIINKELIEFKNSPSRARRIVKSKDTIVSTVRTYLKAITCIDEAEENLICSTGFAVLSPSEELDYRYLGFLFRSTKYIDEIVKRSKGVSYPAITSTEIGDMELILPPLQEQNIISDKLNIDILKIDNIISKTKEQIELIKKAKQQLITEVVTGKIDVSDFKLD